MSTPATTAPAAPRETPGALRSQACLNIQTRHAQKLVDGRSKSENVPGIVGMLTFGRRMRELWLAAQADDPFADWFLIRIEAAIDTAKDYIDEKTALLTRTLDAMAGVRIDLASSAQPVQVPLQFSNPYGYMGAYLVAGYDELARLALTARHFGLLDRDRTAEILNGAGRAIRRTFQLSMEWRNTGVTRAALRAGNEPAQAARQRMGEPPPEVVEALQRARYAPEIRAAESRSTPRTAIPTRGVKLSRAGRSS